MDIYEKWGEDCFDEDGLRVLYRSLYSVSKEGLLQQRIKSINDFLENGSLQMISWKEGDGFRENWKGYLRSEGFADIMWTSTVLEAIAKGMKAGFLCHEEVALFFIMPSVFETVLLIASAIMVWNIFYFCIRLIMR